MSDRILQDFSDKKEAAKNSLDRVTSWMREEEIAYNYSLPLYDQDTQDLIEDGSSEYATSSAYFPADYPNTIDLYTDFMLMNIPVMTLEGNKPMSEQVVTQINDNVRRIITTDSLDRKIRAVVRKGLRKSVCACELVPTEKTIEGMIVADNGTEQMDINNEKGHVDLISYPPEDTFIDPYADPDDMRNTAEYCIVDMATMSIARFKSVAEEEGWEYEEKWLNSGGHKFTNYQDAQQISGRNLVRRREVVQISKMYERDGMVTIVLNDQYVLKRAMNAKGCKRMPLIFYRSVSGGSTAYDRMLWKQMREAVLGKSVVLSGIMDSIGKQLRSPIYYGGNDPTIEGDVSQFGPDMIVKVQKSSPEKPLAYDFHQLKFNVITNEIVAGLDAFEKDIAQITNISGLAKGSQDKQVRTNMIAQQLMEPTLTKESSYIRQLEDSFFKELGIDMLWILYARYPEFQISDTQNERLYVDRAVLRSIKNVRVKNGSTLPEDQMSTVQKLMTFLQIILNTAEDNFDVDDILMDVAKHMGIPAEKYRLNPMEAIIKMMIQQGIDPSVANQLAQQFMAQIQEKANES